MKQILILGLLAAGSTMAMPKIAAALGYPDFSIQGSIETMQTAFETVTKAFGR